MKSLICPECNSPFSVTVEDFRELKYIIKVYPGVFSSIDFFCKHCKKISKMNEVVLKD